MHASTKQTFGICCCVILVLSLTLIISSFLISPVKAQGSGQFPDSGNLDNAGSVIIYSISGLNLSAPNDNGPRAQEFGVWARQFTGTITGGTITVSGSVRENGSGFSAHIAVSVTAGDQTDSDSYDRPASTGALVEWDQSFSVSVTVPQGATTASFSISMVSSHDAGNRENVVYGDCTAQNTGVDHISISSPVDYVNTGDSSFTVTATVFGPGNSQVPDGTLVSFTLRDKQDGTLGDAKIEPRTAVETVNSQVTVTFYPPTSSYWSDSKHSDYAGTNTITIRASAGGKQGAYEIVIYNPDNSGDLNNSDNSPDIITPTPPPTGNADYTILIVAGVVIAVVVVVIAVAAIKLSAKPSIQSQTYPPPPPPQ